MEVGALHTWMLCSNRAMILFLVWLKPEHSKPINEGSAIMDLGMSFGEIIFLKSLISLFYGGESQAWSKASSNRN